jgi:hypothetical protein
MMEFASKLTAFSVIVMFFTVSAAAGAPSQTQAVPVPQSPSIAPARPTVVDKFLSQYSQQHQFTAGAGEHSTPPSQSVNGLVPRTPNFRPQTGSQGRVCSIPLVPKEIDHTTTYAIAQVTPTVIDEAMLIKPAAPSCDESNFNPRP